MARCRALGVTDSVAIVLLAVTTQATNTHISLLASVDSVIKLVIQVPTHWHTRVVKISRR